MNELIEGLLIIRELAPRSSVIFESGRCLVVIYEVTPLLNRAIYGLIGWRKYNEKVWCYES